MRSVDEILSVYYDIYQDNSNDEVPSHHNFLALFSQNGLHKKINEHINKADGSLPLPDDDDNPLFAYFTLKFGPYKGKRKNFLLALNKANITNMDDLLSFYHNHFGNLLNDDLLYQSQIPYLRHQYMDQLPELSFDKFKANLPFNFGLMGFAYIEMLLFDTGFINGLPFISYSLEKGKLESCTSKVEYPARPYGQKLYLPSKIFDRECYGCA